MMDKLSAAGRILFAIAIFALGVENMVVARSTGKVLQVLPWLPSYPLLAYACGLLLAAAAVCILANFKARLAAIGIGIFFVLCLIFLQIPRWLAVPLDLSMRTTVFEVMSLCGASLSLARILPADGPPRNRALEYFLQSGRYMFALSSVTFGIAHFQVLRFIASLIPAWIPGGMFWAFFTGAAFVVVGISVAVKRMDRLAASLLGLMFLLWFLLLHIPRVASARGFHNPDEWSSALIALGMCGASWILAALAETERVGQRSHASSQVLRSRMTAVRAIPDDNL